MVLRTPQLRKVTFREDEISGSMIELNDGDDSSSNEEQEENSLEDSDNEFEISDLRVTLPFCNGIPMSSIRPPTPKENTISILPVNTPAETRHPLLLVTLKIPSFFWRADQDI